MRAPRLGPFDALKQRRVVAAGIFEIDQDDVRLQGVELLERRRRPVDLHCVRVARLAKPDFYNRAARRVFIDDYDSHRSAS